jgi:hypothetical protein
MSHTSERERQVRRHEGWQKLREAAKKNAPDGKLPASDSDADYPPLPPPLDDTDVVDLSMELNNVQLESELGQALEEIDPVPDPDPETVCEKHVVNFELSSLDAYLHSECSRMMALRLVKVRM